MPSILPDTAYDGVATRERSIADAIALAEQMLADAIARADAESRRVRRARRTMRAVALDRETAELIRLLTDEVLRIDNPVAAGHRFAEVVAGHRKIQLAIVDRLLLRAGAFFADRAPIARFVMGMVLGRLRAATDGIVIINDEPGLSRHLAAGARLGITANLNVIGEAILGDGEAERRLNLIVVALRRPDVRYVSVKISAICANVSALAFEATVERVAEPLRVLYREAMRSTPLAFVNLDMEEYHDLALTTSVFRRVLDEDEFRSLSAGIVLQAYLPDSHDEAHALAEWALERRQGGGAPIRIRIVKGANLAMERVEAEVKGWSSAPYGSKAEVDASYKRLLDTLLDTRYADAVTVGVATHNIFDVAWAIGRREAAPGRVQFEMLEGMVPAQARAVLAATGSLVSYTPIVRGEDFTAAIAYLVRRLDENTAPDNFLRNQFDIAPASPTFRAEANRFADAVRARATVSTEPRRRQNRALPGVTTTIDNPFTNEPDTDFALVANRAWIADHLDRWRPPVLVSPHVGGRAIDTSDRVSVAMPQSPYGAYTVARADRDLVERAVATAARVGPAWASTPVRERASVLVRVASVIAERRGEILVAMAHDAGKTIGEGDPEVSEAVDFARYYAQSAIELDGAPTNNANNRTTEHRPLGTVVVAPPWNFPFAIPFGGVAAALVAGNAVILKPAPQTVLTASLVASCFRDAGAPDAVVQFLPCPDDEVGRALITHDDVDAVILTGAYDTASLFLGWKPRLRLRAETSGKNAIVITAAADLDLAVRDLVRSAFGHAGQKCSAASLAIVDATVYDSATFRQRLRDATESLRVGPAFDLRTDVGPLIEAPSEKLLRGLQFLDAGESWLVQPRQLGNDACSWSPGVRLGVRESSWFHQTECFGPVLGVMRSVDLGHALRLQNGTPYGLTAGLYSLDPTEIDYWIDRAEAGNLYVNRGTTGAIVRRQPFGGWKRSVVGPTFKAGGPNYVASLCRWDPIDDETDPTDLTDPTSPFEAWAASELPAERDPSGLAAESNVLRWRQLPGPVVVRCGPDVRSADVDVVTAAARALRVCWELSMADAEQDDRFADRIGSIGPARLRVLGSVDDIVRVRAHQLGIPVDESRPCRIAAIELPRWLREQSISRTRHRHGHLERDAREPLHHRVRCQPPQEPLGSSP